MCSLWSRRFLLSVIIPSTLFIFGSSNSSEVKSDMAQVRSESGFYIFQSVSASRAENGSPLTVCLLERRHHVLVQGDADEQFYEALKRLLHGSRVEEP